MFVILNCIYVSVSEFGCVDIGVSTHGCVENNYKKKKQQKKNQTKPKQTKNVHINRDENVCLIPHIRKYIRKYPNTERDHTLVNENAKAITIVC